MFIAHKKGIIMYKTNYSPLTDVVGDKNIGYKVNNWNKLSDDQKQDVINFTSNNNISEYYLFRLIRIDEVDVVFKINAIEKILKNTTNPYPIDNNFDIIHKLIPDKIRDYIRSNFKDKEIKRRLLEYSDYTQDDEISALRSLAKYKVYLDQLYKKEYKPSLLSLQSLPPVMRLEALEALTNKQLLEYDMFSNISHEDFRALLFPVFAKYKNRVSDVYQKYDTIRSIGKDATIQIIYSCDKCGENTITVNAKKIPTISAMKITYFWGNLNMARCVFCGNWDYTRKEPILKEIK